MMRLRGPRTALPEPCDWMNRGLWMRCLDARHVAEPSVGLFHHARIGRSRNTEKSSRLDQRCTGRRRSCRWPRDSIQRADFFEEKQES